MLVFLLSAFFVFGHPAPPATVGASASTPRPGAVASTDSLPAPGASDSDDSKERAPRGSDSDSKERAPRASDSDSKEAPRASDSDSREAPRGRDSDSKEAPRGSDSDSREAPRGSDSDSREAPRGSDSDSKEGPRGSDSDSREGPRARDSDDSKASDSDSVELSDCLETTEAPHHGSHHESHHGPRHKPHHGPRPCVTRTRMPTPSPSQMPTAAPTASPTFSPTTASPTGSPTMAPTVMPTKTPSWGPTSLPTTVPTSVPTTMPSSSPTFVPTVMPSGSPSWAPTPYPLGEVQVNQGCSNAADITLVEIPDLDAEACKAECAAYGFDCFAAQTTVGIVAWGTHDTTSGGYEDVFADHSFSNLLQNTCKISSCGSSSEVSSGDACLENSNALCQPAGTFGCPADEDCVSVGPASHCAASLPSHTAEECTASDGNLPGTISPGNTLLMDTGTAKIDGVGSPYCAPDSSNELHANSCFGPYQDSAPFEAVAGDTISWEYRASEQGDWYEVMVIILRDGVPVAIPTYRFGSKIDNMRVDSWPVDVSSSNYVIRFVVGSYDYTGGTVLGATMEVKKFGRVDAQGEGYVTCRLLSSGCNQVEIGGGGGLSTRDAPAMVPMA